MKNKIKKFFTVLVLSFFLISSNFAYADLTNSNAPAPKSGSTSGTSSAGSTGSSKPANNSAGSNTATSSMDSLTNTNFQFNLREITHDDINAQGWVRQGINFIFERAIQIMAATIGSAAVLMMAVGGFMMMISAGRQDLYDRGKGYLLKSIIGVLLVLGAYVIVTTVQLLVRSIT